MSYQERFEQQVVNSVRSLRKAKIEILVQTIQFGEQEISIKIQKVRNYILGVKKKTEERVMRRSHYIIENLLLQSKFLNNRKVNNVYTILFTLITLSRECLGATKEGAGHFPQPSLFLIVVSYAFSFSQSIRSCWARQSRRLSKPIAHILPRKTCQLWTLYEDQELLEKNQPKIKIIKKEFLTLPKIKAPPLS